MKHRRGAMVWHFAVANLRHQPRRTFAALAGLTFTVVLVFMQLGFLAGARRGITQVVDGFDFDLVIVSDRFQTLENRERFDRARLMQAQVVPGVASVAPLSIANVSLRDELGREHAVLQVLGVPLRAGLVQDRGIRRQLPRLEGGTTVLFDTFASFNPGRELVGTDVWFNRTRLHIAGSYAMGAGLYADGTAMIDHEVLWRVAGFAPRLVDFGLIRLQPGAEAVRTARALQAALPRDVLILTRRELIEGQQDYFVRVKPVGVVFKIGALVACLAGATILYQVLANDVTARLRDYATLQAMGFPRRFVHGVALMQGLLYTLLGFFPGLLLAAVIFHLARGWTHIPVGIDGWLGLKALGLIFAGCALAAALALGRVRRSEPAELFH